MYTEDGMKKALVYTASSEYVLLPLPMDPKDTEVQKLYNSVLCQHFGVYPSSIEFQGCCGMRIISGFPFKHYANVDAMTWGEKQQLQLKICKPFDPVYTTAAILVIEKRFMLDKGVTGKLGYYTCTLNELQIKQGWDAILINYFGFKRLDDDFHNVNNEQNTSRVCFLGKHFGKPAKVS
jgi:hypothetical protein